MKNRALRNSIHLLLLMYDIRFKKEIKESKMEDARKDGVVMEQTSASPYVANILVCAVSHKWSNTATREPCTILSK